MVQIKLDLTNDIPAQADNLFVSVRVGEQQKLSRLSQSRSYSFPTKKGGKEYHYGRVEIFQRVGACNVVVDSNEGMEREVQIATPIAGADSLGFKVAVKLDEGGSIVGEDPTPQKTEKLEAKATAAKEYLCKHNLEAHLAEVMQDLLRDRPDDPSEYLSAAFKRNRGRPQVSKQEQIVRAPAMKARPPAAVAPHKVIPATNPAAMARLYGKFPRPTQAPAPGKKEVPRFALKTTDSPKVVRVLNAAASAVPWSPRTPEKLYKVIQMQKNWEKLYRKFPRPNAVLESQHSQWKSVAREDAKEAEQLVSPENMERQAEMNRAKIAADKKAYAELKKKRALQEQLAKQGPKGNEFKIMPSVGTWMAKPVAPVM